MLSDKCSQLLPAVNKVQKNIHAAPLFIKPLSVYLQIIDQNITDIQCCLCLQSEQRSVPNALSQH